MTKLSEKLVDLDGTKFGVVRTFDAQPTLDRAKELRNSDFGKSGEVRHIGTVPGWLIAEWLKEAGVKWDDVKARDEVVKRKMMSGDFAALRNWQGKY